MTVEEWNSRVPTGARVAWISAAGAVMSTNTAGAAFSVGGLAVVRIEDSIHPILIQHLRVVSKEKEPTP